MHETGRVPKRIQRTRRPGDRVPRGSIYVGRPSAWGNPYQAEGTPLANVGAFRRYVRAKLRLEPRFLDPLRGRDLVCWCPIDQPCHADVLLELANR